MPYLRSEVIDRLHKEISNGRMLVGASAGSGISAKGAEAGGVDLIAVYNANKYSIAGGELLAGLLPYGDANGIVVDLGGEVLPAVARTPVLAGVCGTDPFRVMDLHLKQLKEQGFSGVQNFPTVGLFDGAFRANLEETEMGYGLEVDMIRRAHRLDLFACAYVFGVEDVKRMAAAGADALVLHMGLVTHGPIGVRNALTPDDCLRKLRQLCEAARAENPGMILFCHGGPLREPRHVRHAVDNTEGLHGFFEAAGMERAAVEEGIGRQVAAFKG